MSAQDKIYVECKSQNETGTGQDKLPHAFMTAIELCRAFQDVQCCIVAETSGPGTGAFEKEFVFCEVGLAVLLEPFKGRIHRFLSQCDFIDWLNGLPPTPVTVQADQRQWTDLARLDRDLAQGQLGM